MRTRDYLEGNRAHRVSGGVCAGIAERLDLDPLVVKIATALVAVVASCSAAIAYRIARTLLPVNVTRARAHRSAVTTKGLRNH